MKYQISLHKKKMQFVITSKDVWKLAASIYTVTEHISRNRILCSPLLKDPECITYNGNVQEKILYEKNTIIASWHPEEEEGST
jgi:hypothetical protein